MADETKRTGGEPMFDPDRAWERFARLAAGEPVPAYWRQPQEETRPDEFLDGAHRAAKQNHTEKDGAVQMNRQVSATRTEQATAGGWRTEKPARRRLRRLTAGVVAAAAAAMLFATPLGDRVLAAMQQTFSIQHMVGVELSVDDMNSISNLLEHGSPAGDRSLSLAQYGTLTQSGGGEGRTVTWDEAEARMGGTLLQPDNPAAPVYQPGGTLTFNLNVKAVNRLLTRLGSDTTLPAAADGKAIRLNIPDGVAAGGTLSGHPVRLLQFGKPELTVEDGIDVAAVRDAVLGLPMLPDSLRTKLAAIGDWQNTLPVPTRDGVSATLRLGGRDAVMGTDGTDRYLLWLDGNRMALLTGSTADFPTDAAFQLAAEELIGS